MKREAGFLFPGWALNLALIAGIVLAVVLGARWQQGIGAERESAKWLERDRQAAEQAAKETQRRLDRQETSNRETRNRIQSAEAAARRERASAGQLRDELAAADAERRRDPAAVTQCAAAEAAVDLRADLFGRADEAAGELAAYAQAARIAGEQCERDYDALTRALAPLP